MDDVGYPNAGAAVQECYWRCLRLWRNEYASHVAVPDLFAYYLRRVTIHCDALPGGVWLVTLTVRPRAVWQAEQYFWKMNELGGRVYLDE